MKNINTSIGQNLKKLRKSRGLTIDALSQGSGVSKSMISEIERGIRNPSITVLWDIANSLKAPLNYFLKEDVPDSPVIYRVGDHTGIEGAGYAFHPLTDFEEDKKCEIYFNTYQPHSQTEPSFHYEGVEEYVLIASGSLTLVLDDKEFTAHVGEAIHFIADRPHYYRNDTGETVQAFVLMFYAK